MEQRPRPALPNLTSLRFFAALLVFLHHMRTDYPTPHWAWYRAVLNAGFTGVSLFFVLSGFILAYNYPQVTQRGRFYLSRFARVYPLYLFALLWGAIFAWHQIGHRATAIAGAADVLLLQTWFPRIMLQINNPGWTLSVEAFFYALFPFLITPLSRVRRTWLAVVLLWLLAIAPGIVLHLFASQGTASSLQPWLYLPPFRLCEFLIGMLTGIAFRRSTPAPGVVAVAVSAALCLAALLSQPLWPDASFRSGVVALPFALLIYCLAGYRGRLLAWAPLQIAGESSYALYIVQFPFFATVALILRLLHRQAWSPAVVVLLFPLSYVLYRMVEVPSRNAILNRFGVRHRNKPLPTADPALP